jgi:16S rRNA (cytosine1402-N4)-methyltransferase
MRGQRSTPEGQHRPVLLDEVLQVLAPQPGEMAVDCTVGWGGHAVELLRRVGPNGRLIGIDLDPENITTARTRLTEVAYPFSLHAGNFAGLPAILAREEVAEVNLLVADLGMSSMQVDDAERGFSYRRDGPLDMRMDRTRGRTAAEILARIDKKELCQALRELGDEEKAEEIAAAIVAARRGRPLQRTSELARLIMEATLGKDPRGPWRLHPSRHRWNLHPAAKTFQVLRILVNRELPNLEQLLRVLPQVLAPGGRAALISFHSGEDRLVKAAFRAGFHAGVYEAISGDPIRATWPERTANPRARSAKLRWVRRARSL